MTYLLLSLFISSAFSAPSSSALNPLVQNGDIVASSDPFRRSVAQILFAEGSRCSATFISTRTLLTAGHCTDAHTASGTQVRMMKSDGSWEYQRVKNVLTHPDYDLDYLPDNDYRVAFDFGLVVLRSPMPNARPMSLVDPLAFTGWFPVTVLGFGRVAEGVSSQVLRQGKMNGEIYSFYGFAGAAGLHLVPSTSARQAVCPGDSGGPAVLDDGQKNSLIGVHSLSSGCLGPVDELRSFSQVPTHVLNWIHTYLE